MIRSFILPTILYALASYQIMAQEKKAEVLLTNGVTIFAQNIEIVDEGNPNCHLVLDRSQDVQIELVRAFQIGQTYYMVKEIGTLGRVILQRTVTGKISVFECKHRSYYASAIDGGYHDNSYQFYLINDSLKRLHNENLIADLKDQPELIKRIKGLSKNRILRSIGLAAGIGLTGLGLGQMFEYNPAETATKFQFEPNPPFISGILVIVGTIGLIKRSRDSLPQIIADYNNLYLDNLE